MVSFLVFGIVKVFLLLFFKSLIDGVQILVFQILALCLPTHVDGYRGFGEKCCLFLHGQMVRLNFDTEVLCLRIRFDFTGAFKGRWPP